MSRHRKHWACTINAAHGIVQEYSDPEYWETKCECGKVTRHYVNHVEEGEPCHYRPVVIWRNDPPFEPCKGTMILERDEIVEQ